MNKELEEFSSLFSLTPSISILDLNNNNTEVTTQLNTLVAPVDGKITTISPTVLNEFRAKIKRSNYDYGVISNAILDFDDKKTLMKIITMAIRDSGYIIILEEKEKATDELYEFLEEFDYGAVSSIDIFEKYNLIMAKKLHMWGMD